ncbi:hypothetical protein JQ596_16520 [Bradyrhizobium manausense]|uniref:hypothetical protein n=1 Tax=Bradyrhizobium TaxID=374 RepID=UPI001BAD918B|nr:MULTISPECIES: hypothetical protein [Bradyrhizobium]MBR0827144.1 hypothetical protein [Bradyrhizobium manausense]UVO27566.1 hypothetical protein KUF59_34570 [Bradyrhizobium arachidis]
MGHRTISFAKLLLTMTPQREFLLAVTISAATIRLCTNSLLTGNFAGKYAATAAYRGRKNAKSPCESNTIAMTDAQTRNREITAAIRDWARH